MKTITTSEGEKEREREGGKENRIKTMYGSTDLVLAAVRLMSESVSKTLTQFS